ncbi:MAG TPA: alpha/beta hydrolase [Nitrososphaeraceae archaeon]|nr:alpha/beta hydrolase [Nitrososphaeraceae archaeon]
MTKIKNQSIIVDGHKIFYREAGDKENTPTILLLHGFPTSSHMFRNIIPALADKFHLVAPDYPGFGYSSMPSLDEFEYTFDHIADIVDKFINKIGVEKYSLYLMDYGAPVGFRLAVKHPEKIEALIVQNGNAYDEGLGQFWEPLRAFWVEPSENNKNALKKFLTMEATRWQYTHGVKNEYAISPDNWIHDQLLLDRPGNNEIQLQLFYDYKSNPPQYPQWQEYFRKYQPPTLVVWGKNDVIFQKEGAIPYQRDLKNIQIHLLNTGHFALEEEGDLIAKLISVFLLTNRKAVPLIEA